MNKWHSVLKAGLFAITVCLIGSWIFYGVFGHRIIEAMYKNASIPLVNKIMAGRSITPIQDYFLQADRIMLWATFRACAVLMILMLILKGPWMPVYACACFFTAVLVAFASLEVYPPLAEMLHLDPVDYYGSRRLFAPHATLGFQGRPHLHTTMYKPRSLPSSWIWVTDDEGFRNVNRTSVSDVILIGDGMITSGQDWEDTLGKRLEDHLPGRSVRNLGVAGYGPFQYLEVIQEYGIKRKPHYAILSFDEGNDLEDIRTYIQWKSGAVAVGGGYEVGIASPIVRFTTAYSETFKYLEQKGSRLAETALSKLFGYELSDSTSRDVAWVQLPASSPFPIHFINKQHTKSIEEIQQSEDWQILRNILVKFRTICSEHNIMPIVLFIPTPAHIYAEYSTDESGADWLRMRDQQVRAKGNLEGALDQLNRELDIPLISLTPVFDFAARNGQQLYDSFSVHLNSKGTELAASSIAHWIVETIDSQERDRATRQSPKESSLGHSQS